ncbi:hypothetical protein EC957_010914 [Mortierella hygrophila]|uniref:F-box domain-containing protein n=1 Tax=Mortierella hygrophila TaxID=979708 RepID=A0A9P6F9D1_9FUNG|nr:hypothetical protein EC957_010914 [Mortierella hygrophila]
MDPLSRLPLECLQIILQLLDDDNDLTSLATLLRTNKYFSSTVLPYLYRDPFRKDFHSTRSRQMGIAKEISSGRLLVRMLLSRLPPTSLPTALTLALAPSTTPKQSGRNTRKSLSTAFSLFAPFTTKTSIENTDTTTGTTTSKNISYYSALDYLAHIRHLDMRPWYAEVDCCLAHKIGTSLTHAQKEYTKSDEFNKLYNAHPFAPAFSNNWRSNSMSVHFYYHTILHHEVPWSLGFFILEQLQSLTIHRVYNIKHYISVVNRLKNLEKVDFLLREIYEDEFNLGGRDGDVTEQLERTIQQDVVQFIQDHARRFPGRLKTVVCFEGDSHWSDQAFVKGLQAEIYRIIPPLVDPTHLGQDNWPRFRANPGSTNVMKVQRINGRELPETWVETMLNDRPLLERCRGLKYLEITTSQYDIFDWAVQERRNREESLGRIITAGNIHNGQGSLLEPGSCQPSGLVPLEHAELRLLLSPPNNITKYSTLHNSAIDSLAFAFGQTLRRFIVSTSYEDSTIDQLHLHIGRGWVDLLALTHLELEMGVNRLVVDPLLLTYCAKLTHLRMTDYSKEYSCQDVVPCQPADISGLQILRLSGWPALTFNPATLSSTPKLTSLELSIGRSTDQERQRAGFIPPLGELNRSYGIRSDSFQVEEQAGVSIIRPHWSWDWDLPLMTELILTSEFALLFEFRMLQGCPALEALTLDIRSTGVDVHTRILSEADLIVPVLQSTTTPSDVSSSPPPSPIPSPTLGKTSEQIVLHKLKKLNLHGKWMMLDTQCLSHFLQILSPNLHHLQMEGWSFQTLKTLLLTIKENTLASRPTLPRAVRCLRIDISAMSAKQQGEVEMTYVNASGYEDEDETWEEEVQEGFFKPYAAKVVQCWSYTTNEYIFLGHDSGRWGGCKDTFERR